jgi:hypothetical protein
MRSVAEPMGLRSKGLTSTSPVVGPGCSTTTILPDSRVEKAFEGRRGWRPGPRGPHGASQPVGEVDGNAQGVGSVAAAASGSRVSGMR